MNRKNRYYVFRFCQAGKKGDDNFSGKKFPASMFPAAGRSGVHSHVLMPCRCTLKKSFFGISGFTHNTEAERSGIFIINIQDKITAAT